MTIAASTTPEFLAGGGEMGRRIREYDWREHPLGPPERWPQSLKITIRIMLTSRYAMWMGWGEEFYFFCNDAYLPTVGVKESWVLGESARKVWAEIWPDIGPRAESVVRTGEATWDEDLLLFLERSGYAEETYHTFSYSPIPADNGGVGGMLCVVTEETERVIGERRLAALRDLASEIATVKTEEELWPAVCACLARDRRDLPFAAVYTWDGDEATARRVCVDGIGEEHELVPPTLEPSGPWPLDGLRGQRDVVEVAPVPAATVPVPCGPWAEPPRFAALVPLGQQGQERAAGFLVVALNPFRAFDSAYRGFVSLLAGQLAAALANVRAYAAERERAEALAELDRAKTAFFSNVSHEFRTPLTLLLGPLEQRLRAEADEAAREELAVAHRNALRLLKLVNSLLDFARIEAGRIEAAYEPTDLAALTADLASSFRSAVEAAGMELAVDTPPLPAPVYVDRDMWEKVVLNLLSNAFKYTLSGRITVALQVVQGEAELSVTDTGCGIAPEHRARLFERFYRVPGAAGRTQEGSGIGLSLVQELVKLHGGSIAVESGAGEGTTFRVRVPFGPAHLPPERISVARTQTSTALGAEAFVEEALRWLPGGPVQGDGLEAAAVRHHPGEAGGRVLIADDNADMRQYIERLLGPWCEVKTAGNGLEAWELLAAGEFDLLLTDVMMPGLSGFELLQRVRGDPALRDLPVIVLSARAGEEARVEGLAAGADDYMVKPFAAVELVARVDGLVRLGRLRRQATDLERTLRIESERQGERLRALFEQAPAVIMLVRGPELMVEVSNRRHRELVGGEWLVGRPLLEAVPQIAGSAIVELIQAAYAGAKPVSEPQLHATWPAEPTGDWREGYFNVVAQPIFEAEERVEAVLVVAFDVTEQAESQQRLAALAEQLQQANTAKDAFLGMVSHELRTPLTAILGHSAVLERSFTSLTPEIRRESLREIGIEAERLRRLIENMLVLSRAESTADLEIEPLLLQRALPAMLRRFDSPERPLRFEIPGDLPAVLTAVTSLEQVMHNLLTNSMKYGKRGTPVVVRAERAEGEVALWVVDEGPLLTEEEVSRLFEPFQRLDGTKHLAGGAGLGLAVCKRLVKAQGGTIAAQARPGGGLAFRVGLRTAAT